MTAKSKTDPFADLLTDDQPCSCGTYREALDEALREFMEHRQSDKCDGWYLVKAHAHAAIATMLLVNTAMQGETAYAGLSAKAEHLFGDAATLDYLDAQLSAIAGANKPGVVN